MKNVTVSKIVPTNPVLLSYVDRIKSWDSEGKIKLVQDDHIIPFYALYYDAIFFGAGTIEFDKDKSLATVDMINGSMFDYNKIQTEAENKFEEIISKEFGTKEVKFSYVKKRV